MRPIVLRLLRPGAAATFPQLAALSVTGPRARSVGRPPSDRPTELPTELPAHKKGGFLREGPGKQPDQPSSARSAWSAKKSAESGSAQVCAGVARAPYSDVFRCPFSPRRRLQCFPSTTVALTSGIRHPNAAGSALAAVPASLHHRERW